MLLSDERMAKIREKIKNRDFDEHDIRIFMLLFKQEEQYSYLNGLEKFISRRQKDQRLKMHELCYRFASRDVQYEFHDIKDTTDLYLPLHDELIQVGKEYNINMDEQTIKEIIVCIYSLIQFTTFYPNKTREHYNSLSVARYCLVQENDALSLAVLHGKHIKIISTISDVHFNKVHDQILITDFIRCERIDSKLKIINFPTKEELAEI